MSQDNVDLIGRAFCAFEARDRDGVMECLAPDIVWYPALGPFLDQTVYRGPEEVCRLVFDEIPSVMEGFTSEVREVTDLGGDAVLVIVNFHGRIASADMEIQQVFGQVHRVRDGRAVEMRAYTTKREAVEAAGRTE